MGLPPAPPFSPVKRGRPGGLPGHSRSRCRARSPWAAGCEWTFSWARAAALPGPHTRTGAGPGFSFSSFFSFWEPGVAGSQHEAPGGGVAAAELDPPRDPLLSRPRAHPTAGPGSAGLSGGASWGRHGQNQARRRLSGGSRASRGAPLLLLLLRPVPPAAPLHRSAAARMPAQPESPPRRPAPRGRAVRALLPPSLPARLCLPAPRRAKMAARLPPRRAQLRHEPEGPAPSPAATGRPAPAACC